MKKLLGYYGFYEDNKGKTSGSKVGFSNNLGIKFCIHKPHPSNILKPYQVMDIINFISKEDNYE